MAARPGITGFGAYLPAFRLPRAAIAAVLGGDAPKGSRSVAGFDEDTTSMGVEAGRLAVAGQPAPLEAVYFATAAPAYAEKTNAATIHAALGLPTGAAAYDMAGSVRGGMAALRAGVDAAAAGRPVVAVMADVRGGLAGGADERDGGDGAAAFILGPDTPDRPVLAQPLAFCSTTAEFLDRWREPQALTVKQWEERFGEGPYVQLAREAIDAALKTAGLVADEIDHVIVTGAHSRAARRVAGELGRREGVVRNDLSRTIGNTGTAHAGLLLIATLEQGEPDQTMIVVNLADGADVAIWRTTAALTARRRTGPTVADQVAAGRDITYGSFLTWRNMLQRETPRRPDPARPAAPPSLRNAAWKFAFTGSRCLECGTRHLPANRVCLRCQATDRMEPVPMADLGGTIATFTVDRLAYSLSPPVVAAVVDFDGGGRMRCEMADVDPDAVAIGDRVEMSFRRLFTVDGVHNYFWKARPSRTVQGGV